MPFSLGDIISGGDKSQGDKESTGKNSLFKKTDKLVPVYDYTVIPSRNPEQDNGYSSEEELLPANRKAKKKRDKAALRNQSKKLRNEKLEQPQNDPVIISNPVTDKFDSDYDDLDPDKAALQHNEEAYQQMEESQVEPINNIPDIVKKKPDEQSEKDPEKEKRTVFVGNLPNDTKENYLKKMFSAYGKVDTLRFRSASRAEMLLPKKVAVIKKEFHPLRNNINAYVRFSTVDEAISSLQLNGTKVKDNIIRVDRALNRNHEQGKAVFLGNLSFTTHEDDVFTAFKTCGKIEYVRLIRDSNTGICKGFGYVNFESEAGVKAALALKEGSVIILDRKIRFSRAVRKVKQKNKPQAGKNKPKYPASKIQTTESTKITFQDKFEKKKEVLKQMRIRKEERKHAAKLHSFQGEEAEGTKKSGYAGQKKKKRLNQEDRKKMTMAKKFNS